MANNDQALAVIQEPQHHWVVPIAEVKARISAVRQLMKDVLEEGADYDTIPGVAKPSLTQVGGQTLMHLLNARPHFEPITTIEDFDRPLFSYTLRCLLIDLRDDHIVGEGVGSCNSHESKYRWRQSQRQCPKCGAEAILRSKFPDKNTKDLGWYCFNKKGGCGAQFKGADPDIINQQTGRTENEDVADQANTILKIAKKRAMVDATLNATGANRIFTQDMDEPHIREAATPAPARQVDTDTGEVANFAGGFHDPVRDLDDRQLAEAMGPSPLDQATTTSAKDEFLALLDYAVSLGVKPPTVRPDASEGVYASQLPGFKAAIKAKEKAQ